MLFHPLNAAYARQSPGFVLRTTRIATQVRRDRGRVLDASFAAGAEPQEIATLGVAGD